MGTGIAPQHCIISERIDFESRTTSSSKAEMYSVVLNKGILRDSFSRAI